MSLEVDLFYSFRSPYSYLATPRLHDLARDYDVDINVRMVLPLAVRRPDFFKTVNPLWPRYLLRDTQRIAEFLGLGFGWPRPDPVVQDFQRWEIAKDQPYIHRLTRLGVDATLRGRGLPFTYEVSQSIWNGETENWHEGDHLARAAERAGLDLAELDRATSDDPARYDALIEENQKALEAAGHWGVPTMVFQGEPFFGQDRIDLLVWRLRQHGLARRASV
jgi:2-hydroxychromene-2-carboxylate isomerase